MTDTLKDILAIQFVGAYFGKEPENFRRCTDFALDESNSVADRMAAINHMVVKGMGMEAITDEAEFLENCEEQRKAAL